MVRPSNKHKIYEEIAFYKRWADTVMPQHMLKVRLMDYDSDVYLPQQFDTSEWPKCTVPFKHLEVKLNGDIPLCGPNARAEDGRRIVLGNIMHTSIAAAWNGPVMRSYRAAHRSRDTTLMPACRGCMGI